jgi:hypothetical protein
MVKDSPLGGIERKVESWRDEIHFTAQGPNSRRKRVDAHKAAATFPDVQRNGGDELKRHLFQGLRNRRIGSLRKHRSLPNPGLRSAVRVRLQNISQRFHGHTERIQATPDK